MDDVQLQLTAMIFKFNLSSKAYTLLNIAKSNIETRIRNRKLPKKNNLLLERSSNFWKKKTLEMYISLNSTVLPSCFFGRKENIKTADAFVQNQTQAPRVKHGSPRLPLGFQHPPLTPEPSGRLDFRALAWPKSYGPSPPKNKARTSNQNSWVPFLGFLVYPLVWIDKYFHCVYLLVYLYLSMYLFICLSVCLSVGLIRSFYRVAV